MAGFRGPKLRVKLTATCFPGMQKTGKTLLKFMIWGYPYFWKHPHFKTYAKITGKKNHNSTWEAQTFPRVLVFVRDLGSQTCASMTGKPKKKAGCRLFSSSWWLNQPIGKICSSILIISPNRGANKKYLKPPPSPPLRPVGWGLVHLCSMQMWGQDPGNKPC